jgi:DNA-binding response OmpR family regulator
MNCESGRQAPIGIDPTIGDPALVEGASQVARAPMNTRAEIAVASLACDLRGLCRLSPVEGEILALLYEASPKAVSYERLYGCFGKSVVRPRKQLSVHIYDLRLRLAQIKVRIWMVYKLGYYIDRADKALLAKMIGGGE